MTDDHRTERVVSRLHLLWNCTRLEEAPYEAILRDVLAGDPTRVEWLLAPTRRSSVATPRLSGKRVEGAVGGAAGPGGQFQSAS